MDGQSGYHRPIVSILYLFKNRVEPAERSPSKAELRLPRSDSPLDRESKTQLGREREAQTKRIAEHEAAKAKMLLEREKVGGMRLYRLFLIASREGSSRISCAEERKTRRMETKAREIAVPGTCFVVAFSPVFMLLSAYW